jgi:hypothetical protein
MSDAEKFEIHGRAHAALKEARSNAATIKSRLLEYAKILDENGGMIRRFVENPTYKNPHSYISSSENLKAHLSTGLQNAPELIDQLTKETQSILELEEQIQQF